MPWLSPIPDAGGTMKRRSLLAALLLSFAAASAAQAQSRSAQAAPTAEIMRLEKAMWDFWKAHRYDDMKAQMTTDAVFVDPAGILNREGLMGVMRGQQCDVRNITFGDVKLSSPGPGYALIAYRVTIEGTCGGEALPADGIVASSLWVRRGNRWLTAFHQQSPVQK